MPCEQGTARLIQSLERGVRRWQSRQRLRGAYLNTVPALLDLESRQDQSEGERNEQAAGLGDKRGHGLGDLVTPRRAWHDSAAAVGTGAKEGSRLGTRAAARTSTDVSRLLSLNNALRSSLLRPN